jgi:adenylate cyclase
MKRFTLRVAISTLVSGLILLSAATIVTALYQGMKKTLYQTTYEMMGQIIHAMGDKLTTRLHNVEKLNTLIADLVLDSTLDPAGGERFAAFLKATLEANPAITLIQCARPNGDQLMAMHMPDGSISRLLVRRTARGVASTWRHGNPDNAAAHPDRVQSLAEGYDPRTSPWWQAGARAGKTIWTDIYSTRSGLNYTNVNPVKDAHGNLVCMVAIDMRLEDVSRFLRRLKVGVSGKPFVLDRDFHVIAMPLVGEDDLGEIVQTVTAGGRTEFALRDIEQFPEANIRHAVLRYRRAPEMKGRGYLAFHDPSGRRILASFEGEPKYNLTFGVVVPEDDILGSIKHDLRTTLSLTVASLLLALAAAYAISRSISRPLATLAGQVDRIRRLDLGDAPPVRTSISEVLLIDHSIQNMRKGLRSFKKYVPAEVVTRLLDQQKEAVIEGEKRELTIFFSDIAGFTGISERLSPEALVERLGRYFEEVTRILIDGAGTVDKFIGDAIMGFWGAPTPLPGHAELACRAALRAQESIAALNRAWLAEGGEVFNTRMGIHTGEAIVGNIGFEGRMNYTAIGDSVNLASRLEGLNKYYGTRILVSETTLRSAGDAVVARMVDLVTVKGKERPIGIHELLAMRADAPAETLRLAEAANAAFGHYLARRWAEALDLLERLPGGPDGPAQNLMERCRHCQANPPGPDWDGVFQHHEK